MTKLEEQTIRNVINRLKTRGNPNYKRAAGEVAAKLEDYQVQIYIETWVAGALECLLPESRDPKQARDLSA